MPSRLVAPYRNATRCTAPNSTGRCIVITLSRTRTKAPRKRYCACGRGGGQSNSLKLSFSRAHRDCRRTDAEHEHRTARPHALLGDRPNRRSQRRSVPDTMKLRPTTKTGAAHQMTLQSNFMGRKTGEGNIAPWVRSTRPCRIISERRREDILSWPG